MSSEWAELPLGDVVSFKTGKLDSNAAEESGQFPFFTCSPITLAINSYAFDTEAVILAGNNANGVFSTKHYSGKFNAYQRTYVIEPIDRETTSCRYVYFVICHMVGHLKELSIGSATKFLTKKILNALPVRIPSKAEQDGIALLLSALDDRITLLRETNASLEAIAQALFKSWFVDFDPVRAKLEGRAPEGMDEDTAALFPDGFEESELGLMPRGWRVGTLADLSHLNPESWTVKNHPESLVYVDLANAKDNEIAAVTNFDFDEAPSRARRVLRDGDTIVGTVRPGNRSFAFIHEPASNLTASTGFAVLRPSEVENTEFVYLAATQDSSIEHLAHVADGGAYPAVRPDVVSGLQIVVPDAQVLKSFHAVAASLLAKVSENQKQAQTLATLRDTLLPRLISGQLRLPEMVAELLESNV